MDNIETAKQLFFDGLAQLEKNDFGTAERLFTEALTYAPQSVSALSNLAITQLQQKKFAACDLTARRLIELKPRNIDGYDILSSSQKEQGKIRRGFVFMRQDHRDRSGNRRSALQSRFSFECARPL